MQLDEVLTLIKRLILSGKTHKDYERVTDLAKTYRIFTTGKNISSKLIQFVQREDAALFAQRIAITRTTSPAVAASIRQPFNKVTRNDRIRKTVKLKTEARQQAVTKMISSFYGSPQKQNRGLEYWLKTRFVELQFTDPNAWTVLEWQKPDTLSAVATVRPFEVSAEQAINFFVVNDVVKWLLVKQEITFIAEATPGAPGAEQPEPRRAEGCRFTLYDEKITVVFEQCSKAYLTSSGYALATGESFETLAQKDYLVKTYTPNVGYVPAFRIGYKRDEETDGRTFVNPWHDGLCYFEKGLKTVSELDLTMALHAFPQKIQYVQKCLGMPGTGTARKSCNGGFEQGSTTKLCGACKGSGFKVHTSAQDAILVPMPANEPKNEDIIDLSKLIHYAAPPIDTVKFQNEYAQQLERQAHQAVFNSQLFVSKSGGGITEQKTATETDFNMQSVYDALEPFTEKYSEIWKDHVTTFAIIAGELLENIDVSHDFPADYKLKTGAVLLSERKTATESGAPSFLIETIDDDLAANIYAGDELGLLKYRVKRRYFPFAGKSENEISLLISSEFVRDYDKVLYCNFEQIFKELEADDPGFWTDKNLPEQRETVEAKVAVWVQKIQDAKPAPVLGMFKQPADGSEGSDGNNPGDNNNPDA